MSGIHPTAVIARGAELGQGVEVGPYCVVGGEVTIGEGARLLSHVVVDGCTRIGAECRLFPFASIGTQTQDLKYRGARTVVEIGDRTTLREYVTVNSGTEEGEVVAVGADCHIMAYSHVAHGCRIGNGVIMANASNLAGHIAVEDFAVIGGMTGIHQFVRIGTLCMVGGMSRVTQDCPPYMMNVGVPCEVTGINSVGLRRRGVAAEARTALKKAYHILFRENLAMTAAVERVRAEVASGPEIERLLAFMTSSRRGVCGSRGSGSESAA